MVLDEVRVRWIGRRRGKGSVDTEDDGKDGREKEEHDRLRKNDLFRVQNNINSYQQLEISVILASHHLPWTEMLRKIKTTK